MSEEEKLGDCFEASAKFLFTRQYEIDRYRLCHGMVTGTGGNVLGLRFEHAWIERTDPPPEGLPADWADKFEWVTCIDVTNGHHAEAMREVYYAFGGIKPDEVIKYTLLEAAARCVRTKHYGPWEEFDGLS